MSDDLQSVTLRRYPLPLSHQVSAQTDALMREFALIARGDQTSVPDRLLAIVEETRVRYGGMGVAQREEQDQALERGDAEIDLVYQVPAAIVQELSTLIALLDEADEYCRAGKHLVTLAASPDGVKFRHWFLRQFVDQIAGADPVAWPDFDENPPPSETAVETREPGGLPATPWPLDRDGTTATITLDGDLDLATAPLLRELLNGLRAVGATTLVLDSERVVFVDSVGLSVVVACHLRCEADGGKLVLRNPSERLLSTVRVAALESILHIES